jgi:hypothetical protein
MSNQNAIMIRLLKDLGIPIINKGNSRTCKRNTRRPPPSPPTGLPKRPPPLNPPNAAFIKAIQNYVKKSPKPKNTKKSNVC